MCSGRIIKLFLLLCALTSFFGVKAQYAGRFERDKGPSFTGQLLDSLTREPLRAAVISVVAQNEMTGEKFIRNYVSDEKGNFTFACYASPYNRMEVAMLGYKPYVRILIMAEDDRNLGQILLTQSTQVIDEVVVKARLQMYKMKGDTIIYLPRTVNTMKDDAALEILRQMPGVKVASDGEITILGQPVERTYVNQKLLFGDDPKMALKELKSNEIASIQSYDEVDEADAVANGANARKRKVLNVVTFKEFTQSYSGNTYLEMGADFHENTENERALRYLGSGDVNFFSEQLQLAASGGSNNLSVQNGRPSTNLSQRESFARANVSGRSNNGQHTYKAGYDYNGGFEQQRSASSIDYISTDYFTSQSSQNEQRSRSEQNKHIFRGDYSYTREHFRFRTALNAGLFTESGFGESLSRIERDGKAISSMAMLTNDRTVGRYLDWQANVQHRFQNGNSLSFSARTNLAGGHQRGERSERREISGEELPLAWETYLPKPKKTAGGSVRYTFNFQKSGNLALASDVSYRGQAQRQLYTNLQTGSVDVVRSEDAFDKMVTWRTGAAYRLVRGDCTYAMTMDYLFENRNYDDVKLGRSNRRRYHLAIGDISYNLRRPKKEFDISLSNSYNSVPSKLLSSRIDDTNPLYVSTGNSLLLLEKRYSLRIKSEFMGENASYGFDTQLDAVTDPILFRRRFFKEATHLPEYDNYLMPAGSTLISPENGAAYLRFSIGANYKVRVAPLRLFLDVSAEYSLSNREQELYGIRKRELQHGGDLDVSITTNFSAKLRFTMRNTVGVHFANRFGSATREFRDELKGRMEWDILPMLNLRADYTGIFSSSPQLSATPTINLLNLSLGLRVMKDRGKVSLNAYDVLNDYSPIRISQLVDAISREMTYVGANYFTVSFEYKFNNRKTAN